LTVADVAVLPSVLPSGPVRYELNDGRLVTMPPPGDIHGAGQSNLAAHLKVQGEWRGLGKVRTETGVILRRNPDRLIGPDAMFIGNDRLPLRRSPEGYLETIPDLTAEIRSKNDTIAELEVRAGECLLAGVRVVLILDPEALTIAAYRSNQPPQVFGPNDILTVPDVIPGFHMPVRDVFAD
jgi:Uma2 family endonuclease